MPDFEYTSSAELAEKIKKMPILALDAAGPAMMEALTFLHGRIPESPEASLGELIPPDGVSFLHTEQQRKWFFASVKKGKLAGWEWMIEEVDGRKTGHPQKTASNRTDILRQKFTEKVERGEQAIFGEIGTNLNYAPWVVGPDFPGEEINGRMMYQARVHVDRWWQFGDVIEDNLATAWKIFEETFWPAFRRLIEERNHGNNSEI